MPDIAANEAARSPHEKWNDQSHWHLVLPPGRPSGSHLDFVRAHIEPLPDTSDIAVLGSTPELRDLCVELNRTHVHVLDKSVRFHEAVKSLLVYENPTEETYFGDWVDLLTAMPTRFDAILSDLTLGGIEYDRRSAFFSALENSLRPLGVFLDKVLTHSAHLLSLDSLDLKYRDAPLNLATINDFSNEYFFLSELAADGIVDIARSHRILRRRFSNSCRLQRILDEAINLVTPTGVWYYGRPWTNVRHTYAGRLTLLERRNEPKPSVFAGRLRLYAFSKS